MTDSVHKAPIHAVTGLSKLTDGVVTPMLDSSLNGLLANATIYNKLPIDLTTYGNAISEYKNSIPAALDGGKTAIAQKNKLRTTAIKMYGLLAHYAKRRWPVTMTWRRSCYPVSRRNRRHGPRRHRCRSRYERSSPVQTADIWSSRS